MQKQKEGPTTEHSPWSTPGYWQERFTCSDTPWELGAPSKVLLEACSELTSSGLVLANKRVLAAGCGRGADALALAQRGARVVAIDWSELAVRQLNERRSEISADCGGSLEPIRGDFFSVPPVPVDIVIEHTFFCAIDPSIRSKYAETMARWLMPGGYLVGNFFVIPEEEARERPGLSLTKEGSGPPFGVTASDLEAILSPWVETRVLRQGGSSEESRRPGLEWVGVFQRKGPRA